MSLLSNKKLHNKVLYKEDLSTVVQPYDVDTPTTAATKAEMEAGTQTAIRSMSPVNIKQAIDSLTTNGPTLDGPADVYATQVITYTVTNYNLFSTYSVSASFGTASILGDTITYNAPVTPETDTLIVTLDGKEYSFNIVVQAAYIATPSIISPLEGATGVIWNPTFTSSTFTAVGLNDTHAASRWTIYNGVTIIHDSGEVDNLTSYTPPTLSGITTYTVTVQHRGTLLGWSAVSTPISFTTSNIYVATPTLTVAGSPSSVNPFAPALSTSAFAVINGSDTLESTDWQILDNSLNVVWQSLNDTVNKLSITAGAITDNTAYTFRVRHKGTAYGYSEWSEVSATTIDVGIETPSNVSPSNAATEIDETVVLTASAFIWFGLLDTHASSDFQVATDSGFINKIIDVTGDTNNLTSYSLSGLVESQTYYWRVKYNGTNNGSSGWSSATTFTTKASFTQTYGVEWDPSTDTYTRTGLAVGTAVSTSYAGAIQTQMKRCVLNANGTVNYYLNPTNSTLKADGTAADLTGASGNVMVEIPKFYYKYENVAGVHKWSVSTIPESGFVVHPAFIRGGVEKNYRYYAAYEGVTSGGKLISRSGATPTASKTRATFRSEAALNGAGWSQVDWNLLTAVQLLFLTEYADFDTQAMIGNGNDTGSDYAITTGQSNSIGNASSPNTNDDMWMSYRGIENWYASMFKFIDGVNVQERLYYVNNNPATFADDVFTGDYVSTGITSATANGYVSNIIASDKGFVASAVTGSNSTYIPDYFYQNTGNRIVMFGGYAGGGLYCGGFFLFAADGSSHSSANFGSAVSY